ncbi:MAG TPA: multiheme c-type cytochrome [Acidobacteriota bacterium]|nr:multiheme c-type cytochrome [Acidobacteriota bacterium]
MKTASPIRVVTLLGAACLLWLAAIGALAATGPQQDESAARPQQAVALGAESCAGPVCHGSPAPYLDGDIRRNEFQIWSSHDRHSKAFSVLLNDTSRQIASNLGIGPAQQADLCLDCHAFKLPSLRRSALYSDSEGVGCEACHGLSSRWLGTHISAGERQAVSGMLDHSDLVKQAELCLSCHQGDESKQVDHRLIAAGHPLLEFELDTFQALMPPHWKASDQDWAGVRRWAVGQAVALRESMRLLARRARQAGWSHWPEFADFECSSCHHSLTVDGQGEDFQPSPRQVRGFESTPGLPPWDPSRYIVLRQLLQVTIPAEGIWLERQVDVLRIMLRAAGDNRSQVADQAEVIARSADSYATAFQSLQPDAAMVRRLLRGLASQSAAIGAGGRRSAQQATMAVDALYASYRANAGESEAVDAVVNRLYQNLQSSPPYNPGRFAAILSDLEAQLP